MEPCRWLQLWPLVASHDFPSSGSDCCLPRKYYHPQVDFWVEKCADVVWVTAVTKSDHWLFQLQRASQFVTRCDLVSCWKLSCLLSSHISTYSVGLIVVLGWKVQLHHYNIPIDDKQNRSVCVRVKWTLKSPAKTVQHPLTILHVPPDGIHSGSLGLDQTGQISQVRTAFHLELPVLQLGRQLGCRFGQRLEHCMSCPESLSFPHFISVWGNAARIRHATKSCTALSQIKLMFVLSHVCLHLFILSCSLCIIKANHLALEELHTARLSCLSTTEERRGQEEPAVWVSVSDQTYSYNFTFVPHYRLILYTFPVGQLCSWNVHCK